MTAVAQRVERRSLAEQLAYLALEARKLPNEALGEVFQLQLEHAARAAQVQADELEILRAEAAGSERALAVVQVVGAEVAAFDPLHGSAGLTLTVVRDVIDRYQTALKTSRSS